MLIGRRQEIAALRGYQNSDAAEFLVVYGRWRVGKTYLIRQFFEDRFFFYATGVAPEKNAESGLRDNLERFGKSLNHYGIKDAETPQSWMEAFDRLSEDRAGSPTWTGSRVIIVNPDPSA